MHFSELVDILHLQGLLDSLYKTTGVTISIVDNDFTVLAKAGWTDICIDFHRNYPETGGKCLKLAQDIFYNSSQEPYIKYTCMNGLHVCACPILVENQVLAILFIGHVLLAPPDVDFFRKQARMYGFDEDTYIAALHKVPVITEDKLMETTQLYSDFAKVLADLGLRQLKYIETHVALEKREYALLESEEQYRSLINNIKIGVYRSTADLPGRFVQVNPALARIFGYDSVDELMLVSADELYQNPADRKRYIDDARHTGFVKNREIGFRKKDGTPIWCSLTATTQYDALGNIRWFDGVIEDITERKQIEKRLSESENRLRDFAQAVPDISFIVDEDACIIEVFGVNKALLPFPQRDLRGCMLPEAFFSSQANELLWEIHQTLITQLPRCREYTLESPGEKRFVEMRTAPMHYNINGKKTVAVVAIDTTELRRTERALQLTYEIQRRSDFFNDIISGISIADEKNKAFFSEFGKDISMPLFCALLTCENFTGKTANNSLNQTDLRVIKNRIIELLSDDPACIVWDCYDNIGILCHARKQDAAGKQFGMSIAQRVKDKLYRYNPRLNVIIGISNNQIGLSNLKKSYQQALNTVIAVRCQGVKEGIYHYQDLGIFQLLATYTENEQSDEFVQGTIGTLIAYDREKATDFVTVLEMLLQTTSLKEAAAAMYVHHKTMAFRKKRIEKILGTSIDGFETRLSLAAAIKLHQLRTNINE